MNIQGVWSDKMTNGELFVAQLYVILPLLGKTNDISWSR